MSTLSNETLDLINNRASTRTFTDEPLSQDEKDAIVNAAFRAPTACNLMSYSIIEVDDRAIKDRLVVTCDNQPMIAKAPFVLLFVADYQKWMDLYSFSNIEELGLEPREPGENEMLLGVWDALIAAQNAVIAAESLGIGSCYVGDIMENGEEHARVFNLPRYTLPIVMVIFGRSPRPVETRERQTDFMLMQNRYHRLNDGELQQVSDSLTAKFAPHGFHPPITNYPQSIYAKNFSSAFMAEMRRSIQWWVKRWMEGEDA